jgi:hypothetical protein
MLLLRVIDSLPGQSLPNNVASIGPNSGNMGWTEPSTMPNPTQHPEPFAKAADLPESQKLVGETNQNLKLVPEHTDIDTSRGEDVKVQGTLSSDAFGQI